MRVAKNAQENSVYSGADYTFSGLFYVQSHMSVKLGLLPEENKVLRTVY
jgi:hypothetical protein